MVLKRSRPQRGDIDMGGQDLDTAGMDHGIGAAADRRRHTGRRRFLATSAGLAGAAFAGHWSDSLAAGYPTEHPIQFIVPFPAGGGTDLVARPLAQGMGQALKQSVVVINKGGAAGIIGTQQAARSAPDGYTVALGSTGTHTVNQSLYDVPYDPIRDFEPVSMVCYYNNVLVVSPSFPAKNFAEFIALIKANPGKYFYGITQNGSSAHLAMELLKATAGLDLPGVPYKGAAAAISDFMGGQFHILMDVVINQATFMKAGKSRPLAVTSLKRAPAYPDIPTIAESGYPGYQAVGWNGVLVPARTPRSVVNTLNGAVRSALNTPAMQSLVESGLELSATTPEELGSFIASESQKWAKLIKSANIKAS
jgi:tripartite-type tricarboxylate transporter receptor subunit TctC